MSTPAVVDKAKAEVASAEAAIRSLDEKAQPLITRVKDYAVAELPVVETGFKALYTFAIANPVAFGVALAVSFILGAVVF